MQNYIICFLIYFFSFSFCSASFINEDEQRVIVRSWYPKPLKKDINGFENTESVGHVSLEIPSKQIYLSLWPDNLFLVNNPATQSIRAQFSESYSHDILQMGREADSLVCLYKINVSKLASTAKYYMGKTANWRLMSSVRVDEKDSNEHNCATIVLSVLIKTLFGEELDEVKYSGISSLNDTLLDVHSRLTLLKEMASNWIFVNEYGINFKAWQKSIKDGKILYPPPKVKLTTIPWIVTPCVVDLWVRKLRETERNYFLIDLIPAYEEKGRIKLTKYSFVSKEDNVGSWSLRSPLKLLTRTYWPLSSSCLSDHLLMMTGSSFTYSFFTNKKMTDVGKFIFLWSTGNLFYKLFIGKVLCFSTIREETI